MVLKRLIDGGYVDGAALTVTGRSLGQECAELSEQQGQRVVASVDRPFAAEGALAVLYGNLAPEGSVAKPSCTARAGPAAARPGSSSAKRTRSRQCCRAASSRATWSSSGTRDPGAGPACARCFQVTSAIVGEGLGDSVALVTDGRFYRSDQGPDGRPRQPGGRGGRPDRRPARRRRHRHRPARPPARSRASTSPARPHPGREPTSAPARSLTTHCWSAPPRGARCWQARRRATPGRSMIVQNPTATPGPLSHLRVLDFTALVQGPWRPRSWETSAPTW